MFHLHFKVVLLRVFEYFVLCAILPRSEYICKATGHCDIEPMTFESGSLTLAGVKGRGMYNNLIYDRFQGGLIIFSLVLSTTLILIAQIITLNKSHLALKSYSNQDSSTSKKSGGGGGGRRSITADASAFDFAGEYGNNQSQRGGVSAKFTQSLSDLKKFGYNMFSNELGALSTSRILSIGASIHVCTTMFVIIVWVYYAMTGRDWYTFFLIYIALFASAVEIGFLEHAALNDIAKEISAAHVKVD